MRENMISVIMPVHNTEKYLNNAINSVLMQTYDNLELICIDDCSTDSSWDILKNFSKNDDRIILLKNENNSGSGFSRNRGLEIAKGKYIFFLDDDDWIDLNTFEVLHEVSERDNLDMLMFKNMSYYEDECRFDIEPYYDMEFMNKWEGKVFNHYDLEPGDLFNIPVGPCNKLYLKSFLDDNNNRFTNQNLIQQDNPFFFKNITKAKRVGILNKYFQNRRRRSGSVMTFRGKRILDNIKIVEMILNIFLEDKEIYNSYKKDLLTFLFKVLKNKYNLIDDKFKPLFAKEAKILINKFYSEYGLHEDIQKLVNDNLLNFFNSKNSSQ